MIRYLILFLLLLGSFSSWSKTCSEDQNKNLAKKGTTLEFCFATSDLIPNKKIEHLVVIRNEEISRGIGVEVYQIENKKQKLVFEEFGLGEVLGSFILNDHKDKFFLKDINGDGIKEFGLNALNERTALFFLYQYNTKSKKFESVQFNKKVNDQFKKLNQLVGTLDHPIKIQSDSIQVYYEKNKYMEYRYKDGAYFQK